MKHLIKILCVIITLSPVLAMGTGWGIKVGPNFAHGYNYGIGGPIPTGKWGFCGGVFANLDLNAPFTIQPELLYMQSSNSSRTSVFDSILYVTESRLTLGYLEMPVLLKATIPLHSSITPNLCLGPYLAYNLITNVRNEYYENDTMYLAEEYGLSDASGFDYGIVLGAGFDFALPAAGTIVLDGRYTLGLSQVSENLKSRAFSVMVGYAF